MKKTIAIAAVALGLLLGSLGVARAANGQGVAVPLENQKFDTTMTASDRVSAGAFEGTLFLNISKDGIVQGSYRQADSSGLRDVTGGLDGDKIWLQIGERGGMHITGTYIDGIVVGYTYHRGQSFKFVARPRTS
jgi:hypothetical protein